MATLAGAVFMLVLLAAMGGRRRSPRLANGALALGSLEIHQNLEFERRSWKMQRVAWYVIFGVLALGLSGLLGSGPASKGSTTSEDGRLKVVYHRILHHESATSVGIMATPGTDGVVRLRVSREWLDSFRIDRITPEPDVTRLVPGGQEMVFDAAGSKEPVPIVFRLETLRIGVRTGTFESGTSRVQIRQLFLP